MNPNKDDADQSKEKPADKPMADTLDNVIRDQVMYQGQVVSYIMDVGTNDPEYDASIKQVKIGFPGGKTQVVPESEIMRKGTSAAPKDAAELDRPANEVKNNLDEPKVR